MLQFLLDIVRKNDEHWSRLQSSLIERCIPAKTVLLHAGEISRHLHIIRHGCLRMWYNADGKDITLQFFFEGQPVASIDSFLGAEPSLFSIESIEASMITSITKEDFEWIQDVYPEVRKGMNEYLLRRFRNYAELFLSRIKDSPRQRYDDLVKHHPEIIQRVPQHYIATYLGITPISLSRIRNRR